MQVWGTRRAPGLLLWWRRRRGEWEGWVIVAHAGINAQGDGPYVREGWVRADSIEPCSDQLSGDEDALGHQA